MTVRGWDPRAQWPLQDRTGLETALAEATQSRALFCFLFLKDNWGICGVENLPWLDPWWLWDGVSTWARIPPAAGFLPALPRVRLRLLAGWLSLSTELGFTDPSLLACSVPPPLL